MKFIIEYGCEVSTEFLAIEANNIEVALEFAESEALRVRDSYEGIHGVETYAEFCEENGYDEEDEDAWEEYMDGVLYGLHYHAEPFDKNNEDHVSILKDCDEVFFSV